LWELPRNTLSIEKARDVVGPIIGRDATIQEVTSGGEKRLRIKAEKSTVENRAKVATALAKAAGIKNVDNVDVTFVGPSWGKDVTKKARTALIVFFIIIAIWVSLRFQFKMAIAALVAVVHDILVTVGIYALVGFTVTPATVIAFLTILGFSLYDTIVVFDKVQDNEKVVGPTGRLSYTDVVNLSMNQVLMRSLNTSFVAILPVLSLLVIGAGIMGATALGDFGLALLIGLLTGAYSSIFVAAPVLAWLKEREERWTTVRTRIAGPGRSVDAVAGALARRSIGGTLAVGGDINSGMVKAAGARAYDTVNPRPRKQGKTR
jgi:preprotein translocase subunit SecF